LAGCICPQSVACCCSSRQRAPWQYCPLACHLPPASRHASTKMAPRSAHPLHAETRAIAIKAIRWRSLIGASCRCDATSATGRLLPFERIRRNDRNRPLADILAPA
jgi:hypothetical protein